METGGEEIKKPEQKKEEEISLDFKLWKEKGKAFFRKLKNKDQQEATAPETMWIKNNMKWLLPLICLLLVISVSSYFRLMPVWLPITDDWATNNVHSYYEQQIKRQVEQQYPNLPERNKEVIVARELQKQLEQNKEVVAQQIAQTSKQLKNQLKNDEGDTYLLEIDTYLWFSEARNYLRHGHLGDKINEQGQSVYSLRNGRMEKVVNKNLNPYVGAYLFKILHFFNRNISLHAAFFLLPVFLIGLALIPTFFIGRRVAGNVGGFFAALFLAINGPLLGRTPAGFSDTDSYNVLLPLLVAWFYLEAIYAKKLSRKILFASLAGFCIGLFAVAWSGWSHFFMILSVAVVLTLVGKLFLSLHEHKYKIKTAAVSFFKGEYLKQQLLMLGTFILSSGIFVSWFQSYDIFSAVVARPLRFITIKQVGVKNILPNVLTTVAEFTTTSFNNIIDQMGGNLLALLAVIGVLFTVMKREKEEQRDLLYFFLLTVWLGATAYAFTKGVRFSVLAAAPFSLGLGIALGTIYQKGSSWINKHIHVEKRLSSAIVLLLLLTLLISPFSIAQRVSKSQLPHFNDAWYTTLIKIRDDTPDSIITSWWDFGHWFQSIPERRVTFDGGDQGDRIHWVGRALLTDNEAEAIGILQMLNCRQELAPHKLEEYLKDDLLSIKTVKEAILLPRAEAMKFYKGKGLTDLQVKEMIEYTHCENLLPNYFITSEDMVSKSGVWGHFGAWDFAKAAMYQRTRNLPTSEAVSYLKENFDLTEQEAAQLHAEIKTANADKWIAPWPGYISPFRSCSKIDDTKARCLLSLQDGQLAFIVDTETYDVKLEGNEEVKPNSIVYVTKDGVKERKFEEKKVGFSILFAPQEDEYKAMLADPLQVGGMFTRLFFLDGHGLKCFQRFDERRDFTGLKIVTWKVDHKCVQDNKVYVFGRENTTEENIESETNSSLN